MFFESFFIIFPLYDLWWTQNRPKLEKFQIAQKPSKTTPNGSKTCFNMFLSVFGSFGIILDRFVDFWNFSIFSLYNPMLNAVAPEIGPQKSTKWALSRKVQGVRGWNFGKWKWYSGEHSLKIWLKNIYYSPRYRHRHFLKTGGSRPTDRQTDRQTDGMWLFGPDFLSPKFWGWLTVRAPGPKSPARPGLAPGARRFYLARLRTLISNTCRCRVSYLSWIVNVSNECICQK